MNEDGTSGGKFAEPLDKMIERDVDAAGDAFLFVFAGRADVEQLRGIGGGEAFGGERRAVMFGSSSELGTRFETGHSLLEITGDVIETNATETDGGFGLARGIGDNHDGFIVSEDGAGPGGVLAVQADVDAAGKMRGGELFRVARVEDLRAGVLQIENAIEFERLQTAIESFVERGTFFAIEYGVVDKIRRRIGLVGGDEFDESLARHRLECVVKTALFADGRNGFLADGFAAERASAVSGIDEAGVGKREKFGLKGIVEEGAEVGGGPAESGAEIGAANVADEKRVAGEDGVRGGGAAVEIEDKKRNGFGRVAGSFESLDADAAKFDGGAIGERREFVLGFGFGAEIDGGTDAIAEFEMAGDKIGVEMGEYDVLDLEIVLGGELKIAANVALRIDDGGGVSLVVADDVGSVSETGKVELLKDHAVMSP